MTLVENVPAVVRILIVFALILGAIRFKVSLGNAFAGGAVLLGLMFGLSIPSIVESAFFSLINLKSICLSLIVCLILVLSQGMEAAGQMARLLDRFQGLVRAPAANLIVFPALIGLLPMPGGAIFSAPMVKTLGGQYRLSPARLSYINYWFRHLWEYWWPLYPGVLLTTTIAGMNLWYYVLFLFPLTPVALLAGYRPLIGMIRPPAEKPLPAHRARIGPFVAELFPILVVIVLGLGLGIPLASVLPERGPAVAKETGLILSLVVAIVWVWRKNRMSARDRWRTVWRKDLLGMFYMISAIMVFQGMLKSSGAVDTLSQEFIRWHISLVPITMILPFLVGMVSGIAIAYVGTAFPILISLIHGLGQDHLMLPIMMLAMVSGYVGVLLSPVHLCLLLSNAYFDTSLTRIYKYLWFPCATLVGVGLCYFWLLRHWFGG